jgi:hypothetical protein
MIGQTAIPRRREACFQSLQLRRRDMRVRHHDEPPAARMRREMLGGAIQQPVLDQYVIAARTQRHRNDDHNPKISTILSTACSCGPVPLVMRIGASA